MSFFSFNQLYGQWHHLSHTVSRPGQNVVKAQQSQSIPKDEVIDKDNEIPKVKTKAPNPSRKSDLQESVKEKNYIPWKSPLSSSEVEEAEEETKVAEIVQVAPEEADSELVESDLDENLKDIDYLHLSSQSRQQLEERLHFSPYARRKFRLWKETMGMCVYCGKHINALDFVSGVSSDVEHIIPQALGGLSTLDNLVCSCRKCNGAKGDRTALDYVLTLNSRQQSQYLSRLRLLVSSGVLSDEKYYNLLRPVALVGFVKSFS